MINVRHLVFQNSTAVIETGGSAMDIVPLASVARELGNLVKVGFESVWFVPVSCQIVLTLLEPAQLHIVTFC